jgi:DNA-binding response OmpR family regulator
LVRILVVDDDPNVQRSLSFTLQQEGYEVSIAGDGAGPQGGPRS